MTMSTFGDEDDGYRDPYDDDEDDDNEALEEDEKLEFKDGIERDIYVELSMLDNRNLVTFMSDELDYVGYTEAAELKLIGIEFDQSYILTFYNTREGSNTKINTAAGNIKTLINKWLIPEVSDMYIERLHGNLQDIGADELLEVSLAILSDVISWKTNHHFPLHETPVDSQPPEERTPER